MTNECEFTMPRANPGMQILWYKRGFYDRTSREVAYMLHCGEHTAVIISCTGRRADAVRHIDDPKLQLNPDQRENGAWDFTDDYKELLEFRQDVLRRLGALESRDGDKPEQGRQEALVAPQPTTRQSRNMSVEKRTAAGDRMRNYHAVARQAKALGIRVTRETKLADMLQAIDAKMRGSLVS